MNNKKVWKTESLAGTRRVVTSAFQANIIDLSIHRPPVLKVENLVQVPTVVAIAGLISSHEITNQYMIRGGTIARSNGQWAQRDPPA